MPGTRTAGNLHYCYTDPPGQDTSPSQVTVNNVGTHLQLSILRQIGVNDIDLLTRIWVSKS